MSATASQVGYDLSRFDNRAKVRNAVAAQQEQERLKEQAQPQTRKRAVQNTAPRVPARLVLGFVAAMVFMFMIVFSYMQLAELGAASGALSKEISALKKETSLLSMKKDSMIDMKEIERIATEELGMVKPSKGQIIYINLSGEDHAVVSGQPESGLLKQLSD